MAKKTKNHGPQAISYPAIGKLIYRLTLALESPLIIGCGEDERSDLDVIRDANSGKPLIPATSLIGVFGSYLEISLADNIENNGRLRQNFHYLFGYREALADKNEDQDQKKSGQKKEPPKYQSALQCDDVVLEGCTIVLRDGVAIEPKTNTAKDQSKYNYEVVEMKQSFEVNLEVTLRHDFNTEEFKTILNTMFNGIKNQHIRIGAKTNKGFGRIHLEKVELADLDFKKGTDVYQWLSGDYKTISIFQCSENPKDDFDIKPYYEILTKQFKIDAWFRIKNSLLIKSYSEDPGDVDATHIKQNGEYVLPGTSVMGAIQHRTRKILNTIAKDQSKVPDMMDKLFGFVKKDEPAEDKKAKKGQVLVEETIIDKEKVAEEVQTRIKIDRFTGGTISGALFEMMPLWQKGDNKAIHIVISVKLNDNLTWTPGLMLLVLKDLWTGDLPIGGEKNVGRGALQGVSAEIFENNDNIAELKMDDKGAIADANNIAKLDPFVTTFWEVMNNGKTTKE